MSVVKLFAAFTFVLLGVFMKVSTKKIKSNEYVSMSAIEILTIPHVSIIDGNLNVDECIEKYKSDFVGALNEVYQLCKYEKIEDVSIELLWKTEKAVNQTYEARIRLFMIFRAINIDRDKAIAVVKKLTDIFKSILKSEKYEIEEIDSDAINAVIGKIDDTNIKAIIKEEKIEYLQNQIMPFCYTYDIIPKSNNDLSRLINVLIEHPHSAVSVQLIPTYYSNGELLEIDKTAQSLEVLTNGVMEYGVGNVSFSLAKTHSDIYKYYSEHKASGLYNFNLVVYGNSIAASQISSAFLGMLSANMSGSANLKIVDLEKNTVDKDSNFFPLPWAIGEATLQRGRNYQIWKSNQVSSALYRLPYVITIEEAVEFFRLPIGDENVSAGLNVNESVKTAKTYADNIINGGDIEVGKLRSSSKGDTIGFNLKDLAKHMLVVGTPGSGKTTFSVGMLDRLWKEHHIPFLVIEPAKNEYRALVQSIPDLQVFTPGKNFISPFVYNPFVPPKNVKLETYKSTLKTAFAAGVSMTTPLDKIFEEAINNCYSDFRWLDTYTTDNKGKIFNITDFIKCFQQTFDEIGYTGDAKNIGRAGVVRLNSLVNLFDNYYSIPIEDLLSKPTIIELAAIENAEQKALIISLLLLSVLSYVNANYVGEGGLKNVILLEEAHVLLDSNMNSGQGEANPSSIAQGLIKRMLAEIRSYGVGLVIADQSPRKVGTDVVALTDMKVVFRLVEAADKQIVADSSNMSDAMIQRMSKLKPGEAFLFFNKLDEPEEVITPDYRLENNISISLSDEGIKSLSTYWKNKPEMLKPYPECNVIHYCKQTCDYSQRILAREIARRIYVKNFKPDSTDFELVKKVFSRISLLIKNELNDEPYTQELLSCVKVHLWRKIKYSTKIKINEKLIENSLRK